MFLLCHFRFFFFFNHTATTEIYTLSLHDALPILKGKACDEAGLYHETIRLKPETTEAELLELIERLKDRKSTRLNSSHANISYAVFCLKKKNKTNRLRRRQNERREK